MFRKTSKPDEYPLWLFGLRVAAYLANCVLLLFALFQLIQSLNRPLTQAVILAVLVIVLIMLYCITNIRALTHNKKPDSAVAERIRSTAHILNAALPVVYVVAALSSSMPEALSFKHTLAVLIPPLLNWLAIEETRRYFKSTPK